MQARDLAHFLRDHPKLPAAVLVDDAAADAVATFMHAGVLGVIPRDLAPRLIVRAFELVLLGGHYVPACALDIELPQTPPYQVRQHDAEGDALPRRVNLDGRSPLSPRQHQIMHLLHLGNTNKVIARALGISEGTVKIHLSSMFRLLGATNRAAAVAIYNGWQFNRLKVLRCADPTFKNIVSTLQPILPAGTPAPSKSPWLLAAEPEARYRAKPVAYAATGTRSDVMSEPLLSSSPEVIIGPGAQEKN